MSKKRGDLRFLYWLQRNPTENITFLEFVGLIDHSIAKK